MDKKKILKRASLVIPLVLLFMVQSNVYAADNPKKNETVYVNLNAEGTPQQKTVTDWLHSDIPGIEIQDRSILSNIVNVKSDETPAVDGENITWKMAGNDIYYQGTTNKQLPLDIKITYYLNGVKINPEDLAGKSGKVTIDIKLTNTDKHTMTILGKPSAIYTPLTAIVTMSLPADTFTNINASEGKLFSDGNNQVLTFLSMPGLKSSLDLDHMSIQELKDIDLPDELVVTADAEDFSLGAIGIAATPELIDMDKFKKTDDFDEMKQDLFDLRDMQDNLEIIDPKRDIRSLITDTKRTDICRLLINDLFDFYDIDSDNKAFIDILPDYVTQANIDLYDKIHADLDDVDIEYMMDNETFRNLPDRLTDENIEKLRTLLADYDKVEEFDMDRVDPLFDFIDDYDETEDMVQTAVDTKKSMDKHEDETDTLMTLSFYAGDLNDIYKKLANSGLMNMSDDQMETFVNAGVNAVANDLASTSITDYESMINFGTGEILTNEKHPNINQNEQTLAYMVSQGQAAGLVTEEDASKIITAIMSGDIYVDGGENPYDFRVPLKTIIEGCVQGGAAQQAATMKNEMLSLLSDAKNINSKLSKKLSESDIENALDYFDDDLGPNIRFLKKEADDNKTDLNKVIDFVDDESGSKQEDNMHYLQKWAPILRDMKDDLDDNIENIGILRDLLKEYDDPKVKHFKDRYDDLRADMDEARPILDSLSDQLDKPDINASLHNSPSIVSQLMDMRDDINTNRYIAEILRTALEKNKTDLAKDMISTLDRLEAKDTVGDAIDKINDADELFARKDAIVELSDQYSTFTGAGNNMETELKFVMKTNDIEAPEVEEADTTDNSNEHQGFFAWCKSILVTVKNKIVSIV